MSRKGQLILETNGFPLRDKDMSDDLSIKETNQGSHIRGEKCSLPRGINTNLSGSFHIYSNNSEKWSAGGEGAAEKTSPEFPAVGDDENRQNLRGGSNPDHRKRWPEGCLSPFSVVRWLRRQALPEFS